MAWLGRPAQGLRLSGACSGALQQGRACIPFDQQLVALLWPCCVSTVVLPR
jgi:hypothetical protein